MCGNGVELMARKMGRAQPEVIQVQGTDKWRLIQTYKELSGGIRLIKAFSTPHS